MSSLSESAKTQTGCAVLFAGQGTDVAKSAHSLMQGPNASKAKEIFDRASVVLGYDVLEACADTDKMATTEFSQPAIFVVSFAIATSKLPADAVVSDVAGFSLGEYAALVFAESITFEQCLTLVQSRGRAMQFSSEQTSGSMLSVIGLDDSQLEAMCRDAKEALQTSDVICIANMMFPKGRVLSGSTLLIDWLEQSAVEKYGALMATRLKVSGAFHSPYMAPARASLEEALASVDIKMPRDSISVYSNVTGEPYKSVEEIRELLLQQLESPVFWEQTLGQIAAKKQPLFDSGPGAQIKAMMRRVDRGAFTRTTALDK